MKSFPDSFVISHTKIYVNPFTGERQEPEAFPDFSTHVKNGLLNLKMPIATS
jgi:hypothetical protein